MKSKKLLLPKIIILSGLVLTVILNVFICIAKKPSITEYRFPFTITYEFGGKTETIEDEFICTYTGPGQSVDPADRHYSGVYASGAGERSCGDYLIQTYDDGELVLFTNFFAGYLMGDPMYEAHYTEYYRFEPYIAFYGHNEAFIYEDEASLAPYDVRIVEWNYPEPIENDFVFSEITRLTRRNVLPMLGVSLLTLLACIIFVKKERTSAYGTVDKVSLILNFLIGLIVLPFLTIVCTLVDINGNAADPLSIAAFFVPAITGFSLAASVCLRRKGFKTAAFWVQLTGIAAMALILVIDALTPLLRF